MYYVVRKGKEIGIYNSLHQILEIHKGWEKDFEVSSYTTLKEARSTVVNTHISPKVVQGTKKKTKQQNPQKNLAVYVDGSYVKKYKRYGVGVLVVDNNKIVVEKAIQIPKPMQETQLHEWYAVLEGLKVLKGLSYDHAILYSDSSTICSLFNGAPIKVKKAYSNIYSAIQSQLKNKKITIAHVKSHNGNLYNERVDQLAGYASGTRNTLPTPSNKLVYKKDDCCFNHTIDSFCVSQSPFPVQLEIHSSNTIPYIESLIQKTNLPLDTEWIPWNLFCERVQTLLVRDKKSMKLRKLKTDTEFLNAYEFAQIGSNECIRRKKVNLWKIEAQKMM